MNEDFVPYELAVKLKEKGYPQRCIGEFDMIGACYVKDGRLYEDGCIAPVENCFTAPRIDQVLKWLREEKNIHIEIKLFTCGYGFDIYKIHPKERIVWSGTLEYETFEQAAIRGIEYTLYNLI